MSQQYSDPTRASEPHALPDVEVFYLSHTEVMQDNRDNGRDDSDNENWRIAGWYWWPCFPGCLPDGDPNGPFATEAEAIADAQNGRED